jgi:N6-adenosine-specific RNA methylase IME4
VVDLPTGKYQVILSDCPWWYAERVQHGGKGKPFTSGASAFYPTMTEAELCALPVADLADPSGAIHFGWTTGPQQEISMRVWRAWEFPYKTVAFAWRKMRVNPGFYTMSELEFVHAGFRGRIPKPRGARNERQWLATEDEEAARGDLLRDLAWMAALESEAPPVDPLEVFEIPRGRHSAKPEAIQDRIDRMFPGLTKIELFARRKRPGWDSWGNDPAVVGDAA